VGTCLAPGGARLAQHWGTLRVRRNTNTTRFLAVYQLLDHDGEQRPVTFSEGSVTVGQRTVNLDREPTVRTFLSMQPSDDTGGQHD